MILVIVIDGKSADDLFAAGPIDLKDHFLPKFLGIKSKDVKKCWFEELTDEEFQKKIKGEKYTYTTHKDNFIRGKGGAQ
jgi:hypothetical protein